MRLSTITWFEYIKALDDVVKQAVKRGGIPSVDGLTGERDSLSIGSSTELPAVKMPNFRIFMTGWKPTDTHIQSVDKTYELQGNSTISKFQLQREDLAYAISVYSNKHSDVIDITQAVISYLGIAGSLGIEKNGTTFYVPYEITDYSLDVREEDSGNISYYSTEIGIVLQTISERLRNDEIEKTIKTVITSYVATINDETDAEEFEESLSLS